MWRGNSSARFVAFVDSKKVEVGHWTADRKLRLRLGTALPTWEQIIVKSEYGNRRTARMYKTLPHKFLPEADYWIWVDGSVRPRLTSEEMLKRWLPANRRIAAFKHPDRRDVYQESRACIKFKKDKAKTLQKQVAKYRRESFPSGWGLAETKVVIRRNCSKIEQLNKFWWKEILNHSVRDQVSLPYVCWRLGMKWAIIPGRCDSSKNFIYIKHSRSRSRR